MAAPNPGAMEHEFESGGIVVDQDARARLLLDAAARLDRRAAPLARSRGKLETQEGTLVRMFAEDHADVGRPEILRLALPATGDVRPEAYFWLAFPVSLWTRATRGFNRIEFKVTFNRGEDDQSRRPTTIDAVPDHELVTRFEVTSKLSLGVGADFKFRAGLPEVPLGFPASLEAGAEARAGGHANMVLVPKAYAIRAARVERSGLGLNYVFWRLDHEAFEQENDPGLRVVLRVPPKTPRLAVAVEMVATRYASMFGAGLRAGIGDLPEAMRDFFRRGTPIAASGDWNMSEALCETTSRASS